MTTDPSKARTGPLRAAGVESELEAILLNRLERAGLPLGEAQALIIPGRKFAFDRTWSCVDGRPVKVAVEVQGAIYVKGAHSTGTGIERDCLKHSLAASFGWRVLPISRKMLESGAAIPLIARALGLEARAGFDAKTLPARGRARRGDR